MLGFSRLREGAEGQVAKAKKRAKPPGKLSWKATLISIGVMAGFAAGTSIDRKTHSLDGGRFLLIWLPMVAMLYLWSAANKQGRWLGLVGTVGALVFSGAPSQIFKGQSNGEQAWVAFGTVSNFAAGTFAGPLAGLASWLGHAIVVGVEALRGVAGG
jgi:hypothetical protein